MTEAAATEQRMTLTEHLDELRRRLMWSLLAVFVAGGAAFWRIDAVMEFMQAPLRWADLPESAYTIVQSKVFEGFLASMKVAFFTGCVLASPVILLQIWGFVAAGLYSHEKRVVKYYALPGFGLFLAGAFLAYRFVMPYALSFLLTWAHEKVGADSLLSISDYVSLVAFSVFVFGMIFQLPVVMVFLMRVGVVSPDGFRKYRRHAVVANFFLAMILTPPDVVSQIALALCMSVLYESAVLFGSTVAKPRQNDAADA